MIWSAEKRDFELMLDTLKDSIPGLWKEINSLVQTDDPNVVMLYSRRSLEVMVTHLCETELKRPRKTEPLKGIIDKLNSEEIVPSNIIASMHGVNTLSTYGAHPKDFDPEQVKPVLNNLAIVIKWYMKFSFQHEKFQQVDKDKKPAGPDIIFSGGSSPEKSIAVLPFKNDSNDEENTYFINGILEEILTNLQVIKELRVLSRTSVEQYRNQTKSIPQIARELGVNYIVEGSAQKYGNLFRLRVQLIMAAKENHLWAKSYQEEIKEVKDIFFIQSQIAEAIAGELDAAITPQEKLTIEKVPTDVMEAYDAYVLGRHNWRKFTPGDLEKALEYFNIAVEKDNNFALAYLGIHDVWYGFLQLGFTPPSESDPFGKYMQSLSRARELDNSLAEVHYSLGNMYGSFNWDWKASMNEYEKALKIRPNFSDVYAAQSNLFAILGRTEESVKKGEIGLKLDPYNIFNRVIYGATLMFARRPVEAINVMEGVLRTDNNNFLCRNALPILYHLKGEYSESKEAWRLFVTSFYNHTELSLDSIFEDDDSTGGYARILNCLADAIIKHQSKVRFDIFNLAIIYACAGNKEKAVEMLYKAYEDHNPNTPFLVNPIFDIVKNDPDYIELRNKVNLPIQQE
jgi:adenylate cyclase